MSETVIQVDSVSKRYRLGTIGGRRLVDDVHRWWARTWGKEDPLSKVDSQSVSRGHPVPSETFWALRNVSFDVKQGEVLGIIGRNGAGKSTLLKILSRVTGPTSGEVRAKGRIASLLEVGTGFHPELTGRENIFLNGAILGMTKAEVRKNFDEIVAFSEVEQFIDTPVKRYSSGMYVRLAFAVAAHLEPEILIIDEVLAVGDAAFQKKCLGKMGDVSREGRTVLFVSHNMSAVAALCQRALLLHDGGVAFSGETNEVVRKYSLLSAAPAAAVVDFSSRTIERYGPKRFAVWKSLQLLNSQSMPSAVLQMGEKASFLLNLDVMEPSDDFEIGIGITNLQDVALHYLISGWEGFSSIPTTGSHTVRVDLPQIHLFPGEYQAFIWIALRGNSYDDAVHEALRFRVQEGRVNEHDTYFERYSKNTQVYVPATWQFVGTESTSAN